MTRQDLIDQLADDETLVFLEPAEFDVALVGLVERFGMPTIVCYDYAKVIQVLQGQGMSDDEAVEWYYFNTLGSWLGDETPCFLHT